MERCGYCGERKCAKMDRPDHGWHHRETVAEQIAVYGHPLTEAEIARWEGTYTGD